MGCTYFKALSFILHEALSRIRSILELIKSGESSGMGELSHMMESWSLLSNADACPAWKAPLPVAWVPSMRFLMASKRGNGFLWNVLTVFTLLALRFCEHTCVIDLWILVPPDLTLIYAVHSSGSAWTVESMVSQPKPERPQSSLTTSYSSFSCVTSSVKTLQGLGMLDMSMVAVNARVQWFNGSVVQRRV